MYIPQPQDWNYSAEAERHLVETDMKFYAVEAAWDELRKLLGSERALKQFLNNMLYKDGLKVVRRPGCWKGDRRL